MTLGQLISYDGREVSFDLAVVVPLHGGAGIRRALAGLGDELGFIPTDQHTLQSRVAPKIFVIGDAAGLPVSKAGSVTHFEGEVLSENIRRFSPGESSMPATTVTPTASSRPGSARRCSSISTTRPSRCRDISHPGRPAAAEGVASQPPRQVDVSVVLLAHTPARSSRSPASRQTMPTAGKHNPPAGPHQERRRA